MEHSRTFSILLVSNILVKLREGKESFVVVWPKLYYLNYYYCERFIVQLWGNCRAYEVLFGSKYRYSSIEGTVSVYKLTHLLSLSIKKIFKQKSVLILRISWGSKQKATAWWNIWMFLWLVWGVANTQPYLISLQHSRSKSAAFTSKY